MSAASPTEKLRRGWIFLLLRWAAAFAILAMLVHFFPMAQLRDALARVPLTRFLAVLLIYLVALTGGITKWHAALVLLLAPFGAPAARVLATGIVWEGVIIAGGLLAGLTALLLRRAVPGPQRS